MEITAELWNKIVRNSLSIRSHDTERFLHSDGTKKTTPEKGVAAYSLCHLNDSIYFSESEIRSDWAENSFCEKLVKTIKTMLDFISFHEQDTRYFLLGKGAAGEWEDTYKNCLPKVSNCYFEILVSTPITKQSDPDALAEWVLEMIDVYYG